MRYKFIILFLLIGFVSKAQVYQLMPQYGYSTYRMNFDSTIQIPTFCGVPKLGSNKINKGALAFDSCNNRFYFFNPKSQAWDTIKSGSTVDTTKFVRYTDTSAMLLPYLRKVDTTNKWVNSVTKLNDSTIQVIKGTTTSNITISSVSSATRLITQVWNNTGATILRGSVVYISGRHSSNLPTIALAEGNNEANSYKTFALVDGDILDNSSGFVIQAGKILGLNLPTSSYTDGDILYLSPTVPGGYTITKPLAPNHIVKLGSVTRAHPTQGSIEIKIENGWQLDELSDVQIAAVPADSTLLQFSRVDSLWHDVSPLTAIGNRYLKPTDSISLSNRINLKLNISDTANMLNPYLRSIDTTNKYVTSVFRKTASDSVFFVRGGINNFAFRDSLGGGSISSANPTASVGLTAVNGSANTFMRSDAAPSLSQSIAPTWTGLHTFSRSATASGGIVRGINFMPSLSAAANSDVLTALDINPTFSNGAFSNVANSYLRFGNAGTSFFSPYTTGTTGNDGLRLISNNNGATFGIQNSNSTGFAGIEYLSSAGATRVFTGFNNNNGQEFRFNNVASGGYIDFLIGSTSSLKINKDSVIILPYLRFKNSGLTNFDSYTTGTTTNDGLKLVSNNNGATFGIQNSNSTGFAGIEYLSSAGATRVFTGFNNNNGQEFRFNNVASGGYIDFLIGSTSAFRIFNSRNIGVGATTDVASAILNAESTTKGFLQPRMTNTQMNAISTPATGLSVFNTTDSAVYIRRGTGAGWQQQAGQIFATASLNFPNTLTQTSSDLTITLTGAVDGDAVVLGVPNAAVNANSCYTAWVSASGVVTVRLNNYGTTAIDPAQATFKVTIIK